MESLYNKEKQFEVADDNKWNKFRKQSEPTITLTFTRTVQYSTGPEFNSFYGSMPVYEDGYDETSWTFDIDLTEFLDKFDGDYWCDLYKYNPALNALFYDKDDIWIWEYNHEPEKLKAIYDLIMDMFEHYKDFDEKLDEIAQEAHDNYEPDPPDPDY